MEDCDEPTGALDSKTSREVLNFLKELNEEGNTIVMITHDNSIALEAKHVVRIHDGKINFNGDVKDYAAIISAGHQEYLEQQDALLSDHAGHYHRRGFGYHSGKSGERLHVQYDRKLCKPRNEPDQRKYGQSSVPVSSGG